MFAILAFMGEYRDQKFKKMELGDFCGKEAAKGMFPAPLF